MSETKRPESAPAMEPWRKVWREGLAPVISSAGLFALRDALRADDPRLIQGDTTRPLRDTEHRLIVGAGAIAFCGWQGNGLEVVKDVSKYFVQICCDADARLGEEKAVYAFIEWYDETPRDTMRRELLSEVERELARRWDPATEAQPMKTLDLVRAWHSVDWLVRANLPSQLRKAKLDDLAVSVQSLAVLDGLDAWTAAQRTVSFVKDASMAYWAAVCEARDCPAGSDVSAVVLNEPGCEVGVVVLNTHGPDDIAVALQSAKNAMRAAILTELAATRVAAWAVAENALSPIVTELKKSAMELLNHMIWGTLPATETCP